MSVTLAKKTSHFEKCKMYWPLIFHYRQYAKTIAWCLEVANGNSLTLFMISISKIKTDYHQTHDIVDQTHCTVDQTHSTVGLTHYSIDKSFYCLFLSWIIIENGLTKEFQMGVSKCFKIAMKKYLGCLMMLEGGGTTFY